jgi:hypothetical protein
VIIRIDDPVLAGLPWEAMYDDAAGEYVCRSGQLVRHVAVPAPVRPLTVRPPLRILGIASSPRGWPPWTSACEQEQLDQALAMSPQAAAPQRRAAATGGTAARVGVSASAQAPASPAAGRNDRQPGLPGRGARL